MYGPMWQFYSCMGSHDMRRKGFLWVDGLSTDPRNLGRHTSNIVKFVNLTFFFLSEYEVS